MSDHPKDILREEAKKNRARMDIMDDPPDGVIPLFMDAIKPNKDDVIALYAPKGREFDCWPLTESLCADGFSCLLPVVQKDTGELSFAPWTPEADMEEGPFKIMQPVHDAADTQDPDILIIPLLAFDRRGYRLGMGGGYYDTTLAALRKKKQIVAVGVAYSQQACLFNLPVEDHDEKLDWVITPQGTHYFGA